MAYEELLIKAVSAISEKIKGYATDGAEEIVKSLLADKTKMKNLKNNLIIQLDFEKRLLDPNTMDAEFLFDELYSSIIRQLTNGKSLAKLLKIDKNIREHEIRRIYNQCIQDSYASRDEAKAKVIDIVGKCIQVTLSAIDRNRDAKDMVVDVNRNTEQTVSTIRNDLAVESHKIRVHIDDVFHELVMLILSCIQTQTSTLQSNITSDNKDYISLFDKKLFLESKNSSASLRNMFIPPLVCNGTQRAEDCIFDWYKKNKSPCMILFGDAGIGKTGLVAKLISLACETSNTKDTPNEAPILAIAIREHLDLFQAQLKDGYSARDVICKLFNVQDTVALERKLLILDGFDELTVFSSGLGYTDAGSFIANLNNWCELYGRFNPKHENWCRKFPKQYRELPRNKNEDKRHEIFCIPFILYLCCNSEVDISENKSVGRIYDYSFRKILFRSYGDDLKGNERFSTSQADKYLRLIQWQYAKELAFQMFLFDTMLLFDDRTQNHGIENARRRTKKLLRERYPDIIINGTDLEISKYVSVFRFAKEISQNGKKGITFVHKTVYEYFAALKIYEDYFAKFNRRFFNNFESNNDSYGEIIEIVLNSFIGAFRYKEIPIELFQYLCAFENPPFTGDNIIEDEFSKFSYKEFVDAYLSSLAKGSLADWKIEERIPEYISPFNKNMPVSAQLTLSFCNSTWFITEKGISNTINISSGLADLIYSRYQVPNMKRWMLNHAQLERTHLENAHLEGAHLDNAHLDGAYLNNAHMWYATLNDAHLKGAYLRAARLKGAYLERAILNSSYLEHARLDNAHLNDAYLISAHLNGAHLKSAVLKGAHLKYAEMTADLRRAHLEGADLEGAHLTDGHFENAHFEGAHLERAHLERAHLEEAHFEGSNLENTRLDGAFLDGAHMEGAHLEHARLHGSRLKGAHLEGAFLIGAHLNDSLLEGAILTGAYYCKDPAYETLLPEGFDPEKHGMIKVCVI